MHQTSSAVGICGLMILIGWFIMFFYVLLLEDDCSMFKMHMGCSLSFIYMEMLEMDSRQGECFSLLQHLLLPFKIKIS